MRKIALLVCLTILSSCTDFGSGIVRTEKISSIKNGLICTVLPNGTSLPCFPAAGLDDQALIAGACLTVRRKGVSLEMFEAREARCPVELANGATAVK
jgi:hypothetical protein